MTVAYSMYKIHHSLQKTIDEHNKMTDLRIDLLTKKIVEARL